MWLSLKYSVAFSFACFMVNAVAQVGVKKLYDNPNYWTNDPFTPGFSLLDKGGGNSSYQYNWERWPQFRDSPRKPVVGVIKIPVLLVDWSDFNPLTDDLDLGVGVKNCPEHVYKTVEEVSQKLNGPGGAAQYFDEISAGKLKITFDVYPWIESKNSAYLKSRSSYISQLSDGRLRANYMDSARDALRAAIAEKNLDLRNYDADKNRVLDGLIIYSEGCMSDFNRAAEVSFNATTNSVDGTGYLHNAKELVSGSDVNYQKFASQDVLYSRYVAGPTSGPFYNTGTQVHELGHLLLGYGDNYFKSKDSLDPYRFNADWLLSAQHGMPIPHHASALEKWMFGGWISPETVSRREGTYALKNHQFPLGYISPNYNQLLRIPINGSPNHFVTVEFRHMAPPSQGGSVYNEIDAVYRDDRYNGVHVFEVDKSKAYNSNEQIRRIFPAGLTYDGPLSNYQVWKPGDSYVFKYGSFVFEGKYVSLSDPLDPKKAMADFRVILYNAPTLTFQPLSLPKVGKKFTLKVNVVDIDLGDTHVVDLVGAPTGAIFDKVTNTLSWTPTFPYAKSYITLFKVTDSKGLTSQSQYNINVTP